MFIKITRLNKDGVEKDNLINTDDIQDIIELTQQPKKLYDESGDVVEEREPTERLYKVFLKSGRNLTISQDTFDDLVKRLVK